MTVEIVKHPLVAIKLARLRDRSLSASETRQLVEQLGLLIGVAATGDLGASEQVCLAPIMRGGLGMTDAMLQLLPEVPVFHLGIYRERVRIVLKM